MLQISNKDGVERYIILRKGHATQDYKDARHKTGRRLSHERKGK